MGLLWLLCRSATFVEEIYAARVAPGISVFLTGLTGPVPFSVAEVLLAAFAATVLFLLARGTLRVVRRKATPVQALRSGAARLLAPAVVIVLLFYCLWGIQYARAPLAERLGFAEGTEVQSHLAAICGESVSVVNELYEQIHGSVDAGAPTRLPGDPDRFEEALDQGYARIAAELDLGEAFARSRGPVKRGFLSRLMSWFGISGYYFPFSGEANVNREVPACQRLHAMAHEKAHQRGITHEGEANFIGFLAAAASDDPLMRYSAQLFAQRQLLSRLMMQDGEPGGSLLRLRHPGVQRDIDDAAAFWARMEGTGFAITHVVNDTFLKANRVEGGVLSYRSSADLILLYLTFSGHGLAGIGR
ncbi:MAG: DUF3810 domain-containing protein [Planctomycetota bacterium]